MKVYLISAPILHNNTSKPPQERITEPIMNQKDYQYHLNAADSMVKIIQDKDTNGKVSNYYIPIGNALQEGRGGIEYSALHVYATMASNKMPMTRKAYALADMYFSMSPWERAPEWAVLKYTHLLD